MLVYLFKILKHIIKSAFICTIMPAKEGDQIGVQNSSNGRT